jgi:hypothetical protein
MRWKATPTSLCWRDDPIVEGDAFEIARAVLRRGGGIVLGQDDARSAAPMRGAASLPKEATPRASPSVERRIDAATAHLSGLPPADLAFIRQVLRDRLETEPVLLELPVRSRRRYAVAYEASVAPLRSVPGTSISFPPSTATSFPAAYVLVMRSAAPSSPNAGTPSMTRTSPGWQDGTVTATGAASTKLELDVRKMTADAPSCAKVCALTTRFELARPPFAFTRVASTWTHRPGLADGG